MKIRRLKDTTYHQAIFFVYECTHEELNAYFKRTKAITPVSSDVSGTVWFFENDKRSQREHWIWIAGKDICRVRLEVLAHEVFHLTHHVMDYVGIDLHNASSEAYAYFQESMFKQCLVWLNRGVKKGAISKRLKAKKI